MHRRSILLLLTAGALFGQQPAPRVEYEAASVKPNTTGSNSSSSHGTTGQVVFVNQSLKRFIERAYDVKPFQVTGPDWLESVRFDVSAKYPPDTKNPERTLMLRTLLVDRFKLAVHHETKEVPGYGLVATKGGIKLKPEQPGDSGTSSNGSGLVTTLTATKVSMEQIADYLARQLGVIVVDKTGIEGVYSFEIKFSRDDAPADASTPPPLLFALQDLLGLRLQAQKVPVDIIVVDHAEKVPVEN